MKNLIRVFTLCTISLILSGCATVHWDRFPVSKSVAIVSYKVEDEMREWAKNKKGKLSLQPIDESGDVQVGFSEFAAFGKGLLKKDAVGATKELIEERKRIEEENRTNLNQFRSSFLDEVKGTFKKNEMEVKQWDDINKWYTLKKSNALIFKPRHTRKAKKLIKSSGADMIATVYVRVGYIKQTKKVGAGILGAIDVGSYTGDAKYEFAADVFINFEDAEGFIGSGYFMIETKQVQDTDSAPEFSTEDYKVLTDELNKEIKSFLKDKKIGV